MSYLADVVVVGGDGGDAFDMDGTENGTTLKKIWVWVGAWQVKAMTVWLTDGQSKQFGVPDGNYTEFIFEDGEHFTSLSLWPSGNGTRLGAIKFKTSHSREFFARLSTSSYFQPEVPVDVASGICMGIKGRSGLDIDCLGFMFIKNIKSAKLTNVEYPTLHDVIPKVAVREIKSMTYHNNTTETQEFRIETSKKVTQKSSWSVTGKLEFTVSLEVKAGIPLIVAGQTTYELKSGVEGTYASETSVEKMELFSFPVKVPPGKTVDVNITVGQATIDIPFNGIVKITCYNDSVLQFKTSGTYKGVAYTDGEVVVNESAKNLRGFETF
ncbi:aerolysin-like protein isoform X1 [Ictalurus furcatus]|uniref:aerolysin-like protein isoform X1 n=1 Tax=Ictalurus furcatus TaxID=66913 RepID=UPI002350EA33|nr:aerolysin-like protein isoform X1 [Ictalurus furcatus]XP_053507370.1 aerolysin-like protein isoform X1 [Ictalurus furcatus]